MNEFLELRACSVESEVVTPSNGARAAMTEQQYSTGKCKTWTLDWTGLMDWTNGLEFGLTIKPKNQLLGSN